MKPLSLSIVLLLCCSLSLAQKPKPEEIQALKAEADQLSARAEAADPRDCTRDCLEAARKLVDLSDQYFTTGSVQDGHDAMDHAGRLALKAGQASIDSKKRRKETEIGLRKIEKRISDIEETLNFEDRAAVHLVVTGISKTRSDILMSLFDMPKKELGPNNKEKP